MPRPPRGASGFGGAILSHTSVTIVVSPRPRVGKTLLARLFSDFHRHEGRSAAGFDLNRNEGALRQFLPEHTVAANVGDIRGQMALFDSLVVADGIGKVVDLGAESFESFFAIALELGFADEAERRNIALTILFMMTPDRTSIEAYRNLGKRFPQTKLALVHNEMFGPTQHRDRYSLAASEQVIRLPVLAASLRKYIEAPPFSFADARIANATDIPLGAHIELQRWLRRIYLEFRELGQRIPRVESQSSFRKTY